VNFLCIHKTIAQKLLWSNHSGFLFLGFLREKTCLMCLEEVSFSLKNPEAFIIDNWKISLHQGFTNIHRQFTSFYFWVVKPLSRDCISTTSIVNQQDQTWYKWWCRSKIFRKSSRKIKIYNLFHALKRIRLLLTLLSLWWANSGGSPTLPRQL
jgi:hypothetical protein